MLPSTPHVPSKAHLSQLAVVALKQGNWIRLLTCIFTETLSMLIRRSCNLKRINHKNQPLTMLPIDYKIKWLENELKCQISLPARCNFSCYVWILKITKCKISFKDRRSHGDAHNYYVKEWKFMLFKLKRNPRVTVNGCTAI